MSVEVNLVLHLLRQGLDIVKPGICKGVNDNRNLFRGCVGFRMFGTPLWA